MIKDLLGKTQVQVFGEQTTGAPVPWRMRRGRGVLEDVAVYLVVPAVSTSPAYTVGDVVGGKLTIPAAVDELNGYAWLESINIVDRANQKSGFTFLIFNNDPTAATLTDNGGIVITSADDIKILAKVTFVAADYDTCGAKAYANRSDLRIPLRSLDTTNRNLYAAIVAQGTPTFAAVTDLQIYFGITQR